MKLIFLCPFCKLDAFFFQSSGFLNIVLFDFVAFVKEKILRCGVNYAG